MFNPSRFLEVLMMDFIRKKLIIKKLQDWYQKHQHHQWFKLVRWFHPNLLTISRVVIFSPLVVFFLITQQKETAVIFWLIGWLTDALDGPLAIVTNRQTVSGKFLDPVCDRIYFFVVISTTLVIYYLPLIINLSLCLIMLLELVLPALYLVAKLEHKRATIYPHNAFGKLKTCLLALIVPLIWFSKPENNWQFILGSLIGAALLASLINIKKIGSLSFPNNSPS